MPRLGDYETWVEVDGVRLEEYAIESRPEELDMRCWIPSEEGKNFVVHYKNHGEGRKCRWKLHCDGRRCGGTIMKRDRSQSSKGGRFISSTEEQLFQFGRISLTEDEQVALQDETLIKELGTLKIVVEDGTTVRKAYEDKGALAEQKPVHEQTKKAAGHCVVGGAIVQSNRQFVTFTSSGRPATAFVFQYGPKELLQAKGIMPPPPRVINPDEEDNDESRRDNPDGREETSDEDFEDETAAEARAARISQLKANIESQQEELEALNNLGKRKGRKDGVKREDAERPGKRLKMEEIEPNRSFARGEVIDLT
ncbi:hypothetical protein CALVIDRAFT_558971 [Calocera viscosa TUFC12733]|uniref:DUF7918 domain-containing protein n=1 Tax=Calocera viscosa (strain TUFC12733) TaxID=1330018 RepID=A0A167FVJ1_CALVF|nr:hypothetical protein CALVIDRAFT_558971 [Calocera viscosa TUFC12733]